MKRTRCAVSITRVTTASSKRIAALQGENVYVKLNVATLLMANLLNSNSV